MSLFNGYRVRFQFGKEKNVLEMDGGDGCETMRMYFVPLKYTQKMVKMECIFYTTVFKKLEINI